MSLNDAEIILKKITVAVLIYLIPVALIIGGLWLTTIILKKNKVKNEVSYSVQP